MKYVLSYGCVISFLLTICIADLDSNDITFIFYNRDHIDEETRTKFNEDPNLLNIQKVFNPHLPTIVLVHGWKDDFEANSNKYIRKSIFSKNNANVIKVDWSPSSGLGYFAARDAVPKIGRLVASLLSRISMKFHYPLSNVTLVGFSLGAHISGNVGKALGGQIGVIVALDPAGPFISSKDGNFSVQPTDAQYVQAIHTNAGTLGMSDAVGHSDFYPNGGSRQPGCGMDLVGGCAHNRAWEYFAESLTSKKFVATRCESWNVYRKGRCNDEARIMGGINTIDKNARGIYYLETNRQSPYGRS